MDCRLGVLAFGDSITNGGGELQWGVALQSWALWTARGLGLPYTRLRGRRRHGGATSWASRSRLRARAAPDARYDVGCLYVGVNDVRAPDWDPAAYERDVRAALGVPAASAASACWPARSRSTSAGRARGAARGRGERGRSSWRPRSGALVVDLRDFGARNRVMVDAVHPTAFGQIAIAERALDVLAADGMAVRVRPSTLIALRDDALAAPARRRHVRVPAGSSRRVRHRTEASARAADPSSARRRPGARCRAGWRRAAPAGARRRARSATRPAAGSAGSPSSRPTCGRAPRSRGTGRHGACRG